MSAQQQLVGAAGVGLVVANAWTGTQRTDLAQLFGTPAPGAAVDGFAPHHAAKAIGAELIGVTALVLVAGAGTSAGNAALAAIACLWLLFLAQHYGTPQRRTKTLTKRKTGGLI